MITALIVAAGSGQRLGAASPKALIGLAGRPMLHWSLEALAALEEVGRIVIALPPGAALPEVLAGLELPGVELVGVAGGATRSDSVRLALGLAGSGDPVLVHDAARPLLTAALARRVIATLAEDPAADAAIAAAPVADTIKRVGTGSLAVTETLPRSDLWAVQTPQVFRRAALQRALEVPAEVLAEATDDAWLIERSGGRVLIAAVSEANFKVTTPIDLELVAGLLASRPAEPS
jgi:2-C-methyl-D-erythritol 4-phosphate cytidylyltransferase